MQNLKHIKSFLFDYAQYQLDDGAGDRVVLQVNYKENTFSIESKTLERNEKFRSEICEIAAGLLSRKHAVNFANK